MIKQFNFYKSYMDTIGNLTHAEAGQYIKKMLEFMFRDKAWDELATDKVTSLLLLISDDLSEEKSREEQNNHAPMGTGKRFTFRSVYANIFLLLKDTEAGILIKQVCDYMFGGSLIKTEECKCVGGYFTALKAQLSKSKAQSERAKKKPQAPVTLEKIRLDFPFITGSLRSDNTVLDGVSLDGLYQYIRENQESLRGLKMYAVAEKYREKLHTETIPN